MDPISSGTNPTNNPRMDLLHNTGSNQKVGGTYGAGSLTVGPSPSPRMASSYVAAAQNSKPETPNPQPPASGPIPGEGQMTVAAQADSAHAGQGGPLPAGGGAPVPEPKPAPPAPTVPPPPQRRRIGAVLAVLALLIMAGAAAWWFFVYRNQPQTPASPPPQAVEAGTLNNPRQANATGEVGIGKSTKNRKLTLQATLPTTANTGSVTPEVELRPLGEAFTGEPTIKGDPVAANGSDLRVAVVTPELADGSYHWQIRVDSGGKKGDWLVAAADQLPAFTVDTLPPAAPSALSAGGSRVAGGKAATTGGNRPVFSGQSEPSSTVTVAVSPENISLSATADQTGAWSVTPDSDIPNGQHEVSVTASDAAGNVSQAAAFTLTVNPLAAAGSAAGPSRLAATGDPLQTSLALLVMAAAAAGYLVTRRLDEYR